MWGRSPPPHLAVYQPPFVMVQPIPAPVQPPPQFAAPVWWEPAYPPPASPCTSYQRDFPLLPPPDAHGYQPFCHRRQK
nr:unnamed protein product [Callosobruchus chinensis]